MSKKKSQFTSNTIRRYTCVLPIHLSASMECNQMCLPCMVNSTLVSEGSHRFQKLIIYLYLGVEMIAPTNIHGLLSKFENRSRVPMPKVNSYSLTAERHKCPKTPAEVSLHPTGQTHGSLHRGHLCTGSLALLWCGSTCSVVVNSWQMCPSSMHCTPPGFVHSFGPHTTQLCDLFCKEVFSFICFYTFIEPLAFCIVGNNG